MRVRLVQDAARLVRMAYWEKERLESFVPKEVSEEVSNVSVEIPEEVSNVSIEVSEEVSNVSIEVSEEVSNVSVEVSEEVSNVSVEVPEEVSNVSVEVPEEVSNVSVEVPTLKDRLTQPIVFYETEVDAQCFTTQYEDGLCMVFRGTTNTQDWMINADALQDPMYLSNTKKTPKVHGGFLRQFQSLQTSLMQTAIRYMGVHSIRDSNRTVYYMGHSLGGALATLAAAYFGSLYPDVRHVCITFGAPRVGDSVFVSEFKKHVDESVRCVNQEDPVPLVPASCLYEHVYGIAYIDCDETIQREILENRLLNTCRDSFLCCFGMAENPLHDHDMRQYESTWKKYGTIQ